MDSIKRRLIGMSVALLVVVAFGLAAKSNNGTSEQTSLMIQQVEEAFQSMADLEKLAR